GSGGILAPDVHLATQLHWQVIRTGIQTDNELRPLSLDRLRQAVGKVRRRDGRHAKEVTRVRRRRRPKAPTRRRRPKEEVRASPAPPFQTESKAARLKPTKTAKAAEIAAFASLEEGRRS